MSHVNSARDPLEKIEMRQCMFSKKKKRKMENAET